jgi:hypothetical protein
VLRTNRSGFQNAVESLEVMVSMDDKDRFNLLYASLVDTFKGYVDNVMKTMASIIIAIGWILTSDTSRHFLMERKMPYVLSLAAVAVISIIHTAVSFGFYSQSQAKASLISNLRAGDSPFIEPSYYANYQITLPLVVANLVLNFSLFAVLFMMIFTLR